MTGKPYAGALDDGRVFVMWGQHGDALEIDPDGTVRRRLTPPPVQLIDLLDEVIDRDAVLSALSGVRPSRRVREELAELLDADADDIGKRP